MKSVHWAVVIFPGSNCDADCVHAIGTVLRHRVTRVWHTETIPADVDCVVIPGGFSYGDYLRAGALAARSGVMASVRTHAEAGKPVIGICNGFQVLVESGLLPGVLIKNDRLRFRCHDVHLRVEHSDTPFTRGSLGSGQVIRLPIAHGYGNYYLPPDQLAEVENNQQVLLRYCNTRGMIHPDANPNGSIGSIAGVLNRQRNVLGLMPHPERACEALLGGTDGRFIFAAMAAWKR